LFVIEHGGAQGRERQHQKPKQSRVRTAHTQNKKMCGRCTQSTFDFEAAVEFAVAFDFRF
jgi:hypothetical protein